MPNPADTGIGGGPASAGPDHTTPVYRTQTINRFSPLPDRKAPTDAPVMIVRSLRHAKAQRRADGTVRMKIPEGHFSTRSFLKSAPSAKVFTDVVGDRITVDCSSPGARLAINTISCPDLYEADLAALAVFLAGQSVPIINSPERILGTGRADMAKRLAGIPGLVVPRTIRIDPTDGAPLPLMHGTLAGVRFPVILRVAGAHTGRTAVLVKTPTDLGQAISGLHENQPLYVTEFVDPRREETLFTKYRAFFIDGCFYPVARLVANRWNIHSGDRYRVMFAMPEAQARERDYLANPADHLGPRAMTALHAIRDRVMLDFFGIDFTTLASGEVLVFEVNAVMRHNYDHAKTFPYTKAYLDHISDAFDAMVRNRCECPSR